MNDADRTTSAAPTTSGRALGWRGLIAAAVVALLLVSLATMWLGRAPSIGTSPAPSDASAPAASTTAVSSSAPNASPSHPATVDGLDVFAVGDLLTRRAAGEIGGDPVALRGYWTNRWVPHSCSAPTGVPGVLEIYCHDLEFGITELREPIGTLLAGGRFLPHQGPALTPFIEDDLADPLFTLPAIRGQPYPPVPILVIGHFDDPRAADCRPEAQQRCRDRFVVDEIVEFDPKAVPTPGITPPPTPFPFDDPPPAPFTDAECSGDVAYSFVGWGRLSDFGVEIGGDEVLYLMITRDAVDLGEPGGPVGRLICYAHEWERDSVSYAELP